MGKEFCSPLTLNESVVEAATLLLPGIEGLKISGGVP